MNELPFRTAVRVVGNTINPTDLPVIRDCETKVVFKNTKPAEGEKVLFAGCDFRSSEKGIPIDKWRGRLLYKGNYYQYAVTAGELK